MDCLKATEIISAAHDGEPVGADELREATDHCHACPSCAQFQETLLRIDPLLVPTAPPTLVERLDRTLDGLAAEREQQRVAFEAGLAPVEPVAREGATRSRAWSGRLVAFASAAAVLLLAIGVTSVVLLRGLGAGGGVDSTESAQDTAMTAPLAAVPESDSGEAADSARTAGATYGVAPAYITVDGAVWLLAGPAEVAASELTTASTIMHALEDTGTPVQHVSYRAPGDGATLYVRTAEGGLLAFERVVRSLGRRQYALVSGTPLLRFGEWPILPARFKTPQAQDGSPTFRALAKDDSGVDIFVPPTGDIAQGFAIAPGTAPDDPAAGNPGWTWWEPLP